MFAKLFTWSEAVHGGTRRNLVENSDAFPTKAGGTFSIAYYDSLSMKSDGAPVPFARLVLERCPPLAGTQVSSPAFSIEPAFDPTLLLSKVEDQPKAAHIINDQLARCLGRLGLLAPPYDAKLKDVLESARRAGGLYLWADSNALAYGAVSWLARALAPTPVLLAVTSITTTQLQEKDRRLKPEGPLSNNRLPSSLRTRSVIQGCIAGLERGGTLTEILQVDAELLRYVRAGGKGSADPDETDVLEDRLMVEALHREFLTRRTRLPRYAITFDAMLAVTLHAEGIPYLFLPTPSLPLDGQGSTLPVRSVGYDALARQYVVVTLERLLTELTVTFSEVYVWPEGGKPESALGMRCYWPGRTPDDILLARTRVGTGMATQTGETGAGPGQLPESDDAIPSNPPSGDRTARQAASSSPFKACVDALRSLVTRPTYSRREFYELQRKSKQIVDGALQVLVPARLAGVDETNVFAGPRFDEFMNAWRGGDLDLLSGILRDYPPYDRILRELNDAGELPRDLEVGDPKTILNRLEMAEKSYRSLRMYPISLGQAWIDGQVIRDGQGRPSPERFTEVLKAAFDTHQRDQVASFEQLIPAVCRQLKMSPWALHRYMGRSDVGARLAEYRFEEAISRPIRGPEQLLAPPDSEDLFYNLPINYVQRGEAPRPTMRRAKTS